MHRQKDPEFAAQVADAYTQAIDLLEARAFQRALEGDLEPVYYMGVVVDYVRKFDSKLQIELLRARARYAKRWRSKFLAFLSVSDSPYLAARSARIDTGTIYKHRQKDPEFAAMWADASRIAIDLLEARVFQLAVEGNLEPIHYMGVVVDYVRKFDSKLQIELLRAKRPDTFKTPGAANINIGTKGDVFVFTEEQRHILMDYNRQWLLDHPPPAEEPGRSDMAATAPATYGANYPSDPPRDK